MKYRFVRFTRVEWAIIVLLIATVAYFAGHLITASAVRSFPPGSCYTAPDGHTYCEGK